MEGIPMTWSDFCAMLADAAQQPVFIVICGLFVFIAGLGLGLAMRRHDDRRADDAGDTHTAWNLHRLDIPARPAALAAPKAARPRLRAIGGATLKPSYDGRKAPPMHRPV
jgi:hypothetical protein